MEFNFKQQHNNQVYYHTPSSTNTYFSNQAVKEGLWNGSRGSMDSREEIQIELEKERIREQIVAKEIVRLKEELRRGMTVDNGGGFPSAFGVNNGGQPVSLEEKYGGTAGHYHREIGGFEGYPNGSANWKPPLPLSSPPMMPAPPPPPRYPEFWNENGSRLHGESQSLGLRGSMDMEMMRKERQKHELLKACFISFSEYCKLDIILRLLT